MKVVVFSPYAISAPHFETELEIIQRHLDRGDEVVVLACYAELTACDYNLTHEASYCLNCVGKRRAGMALLSRRVPVRSFCGWSHTAKKEVATLRTDFASLEELKAFRVDNFEIGYAVLASFVDEVRDPKPEPRAHAALFRDLLVSALTAYRSLQAYLDQHRVDRVYVYNGRVACARAALRACESRGVDCFVHDRGHNLHHYALFKNGSLHNRDHFERLIREQWARAAGRPDREEVGAQFFHNQAKGVDLFWFSFVKDQRAGLLPDGWDPGKRNVVLFNSSEDEAAAIDDSWRNPLYQDQLDGLRRIVRSLAGCGREMHLYLRVHPNLKGVKNWWTEQLMGLRSDVLTVIAPEDPVSTYALIGAADTVVTFGSTVGIEAVFWGKPSVLAGQSMYRNLGATYNPASHEELVEMVKAPLPPKDKEGALMYGYFMRTFGLPYRYVTATEVYAGKFKGRLVEPGPGLKWAIRFCQRFWHVGYYLNRIAGVLAHWRLTGKFRPGRGAAVSNPASGGRQPSVPASTGG